MRSSHRRNKMWTLTAACLAAPRPAVRLHQGMTNLPRQLHGPGGRLLWPPPAPMSNIVKHLGDAGNVLECQARCIAYRNRAVSPVSGWVLCRSFTLANRTACIARVDAAWAPRPQGGAVAGRVTWPPQPCAGARDCSHNGVCGDAGPNATGRLCRCHPGWMGDRCQSLRVLRARRGAGLVVRSVDGHPAAALPPSTAAGARWGSQHEHVGRFGGAGGRWQLAHVRLRDGRALRHRRMVSPVAPAGGGGWPTRRGRTTNSHVVHAVSNTPGGKYERTGREVFPVFSHEPNVGASFPPRPHCG